MPMVFAVRLPHLLLSLAALFLISTCALAQQADKLPADQSQPDAGYRIHKGDRLSVRFTYHSELSEPSLVVRPDGFITLQMINDIKAEGLTAGELKGKLEEAYKELLLNPVISVGLVEFVAPRVFVSGQVNRPSSIPLREGDTLIQAITLAGGFTPAAHRRMVLLARPVGNRLECRQVDMLDLLSPKGGTHDERLQDGDYIFVPDSKLSKFQRVIEAFRFAVPSVGYTLTPVTRR